MTDGALPRHAVILAAGLGTRMRPMSAAVPKHMLPLGIHPIVHYLLSELEGLGIPNATIVINPRDRVTRAYFTEYPPHNLDLSLVVQASALGPVDAYLRGWAARRHQVSLVLLADCVLVKNREIGSNAAAEIMSRLLSSYVQSTSDCLVLAKRERSKRCGKLAGIKGYSYPLSPCGRWIIGPRAREFLAQSRELGSDLRFTSLFSEPAASMLDRKVVLLERNEQRLDLGVWADYFKANRLLQRGLKGTFPQE